MYICVGIQCKFLPARSHIKKDDNDLLEFYEEFRGEQPSGSPSGSRGFFGSKFLSSNTGDVGPSMPLDDDLLLLQATQAPPLGGDGRAQKRKLALQIADRKLLEKPGMVHHFHYYIEPSFVYYAKRCLRCFCLSSPQTVLLLLSTEPSS